MAFDILQQPLTVHIGLVLLLLWIASLLHISSIFIFLLAFLFLYEADKRYVEKTRRHIRYEERRSAYRRRPLSDPEAPQWLNVAIKKIWPFFGQAFSQELLISLIPWFLDKYKPWTARNAVLRHLDLGKDPPFIRSVRTVSRSADDDDLVMDLKLEYIADQNMSAVLAVQMRRRLGFGFWTTIHISKVQLEGKVRIGVKFSSTWPFLSRVRICFENAPSVQMTAKPLSHHGVDVSEFPGIAGWMDRMMADALEQSLVEPNMLVIDVSKLISSMMNKQSSQSTVASTGNWFDIYESPPIANVRLEILEAADLKASDLNGMSDPFVKGILASYRFKTKTQKKTLTPKWEEEFLIPIASWDLPNSLLLHVRDKDQIHNDRLGFCRMSIANFRGGQRHDIWLPLDGVKTGKIHVAITVIEKNTSFKQDTASAQGNAEHGTQNVSSHQSPGSILHVDDVSDSYSKLVPDGLDEEDEFENISLEEGLPGTVSIMRPGISTEVDPRRGNFRAPPEREELGKMILDPVSKTADIPDLGSDGSTTEDEHELSRTDSGKRRLWGLRISHSSSPKKIESDALSPKDANIKKRTHLKNIKGKKVSNIADTEVVVVGHKGTAIRTKIESAHQDVEHGSERSPSISTVNQEILDCNSDSPSAKRNMKMRTKSLFKHAGKKAHDLGHALARKGSGHGHPSGQTEDANLALLSEITKDENQLSDEKLLPVSDENLFKNAGRKVKVLGHALARKGSGHQSLSGLMEDRELASSSEFAKGRNQFSSENLLPVSDSNQDAGEQDQESVLALARKASGCQNLSGKTKDGNLASSSEFTKDGDMLSDVNLSKVSDEKLFKHAGKEAQNLGHSLAKAGSSHKKSYDQTEDGKFALSSEIREGGNQLLDENLLSVSDDQAISHGGTHLNG